MEHCACLFCTTAIYFISLRLRICLYIFATALVFPETTDSYRSYYPYTTQYTQYPNSRYYGMVSRMRKGNLSINGRNGYHLIPSFVAGMCTVALKNSPSAKTSDCMLHELATTHKFSLFTHMYHFCKQWTRGMLSHTHPIYKHILHFL